MYTGPEIPAQHIRTKSTSRAIGARLRAPAFLCGAAVALLIVFLTSCHLYYVLASGMEPSTDEGHYLTGVAAIANGLKTQTLSGTWFGYIHALGFKAPLVCVPAALAAIATGGFVKAALVSLVATFTLLGFASFALFRRCLPNWSAFLATTLLLTMPMITGLTHRIYVELLLVLLLVTYLNVLSSAPWGKFWPAGAVGLLFGLGTLCKVVFPALVALPTLYSFAVALRGAPGSRARLRIAASVVVAGMAAVLVAWPWYAENWRAVIHHAQISSAAATCYFPYWVQADISAGPGLFIFCFALVGAFQLLRGRVDLRSGGGAWILILLSGLTTVLMTAAAVNKATRFAVTALPMIAVLAAVPWRPEKNRRHATVAALLAGAVGLLFLHNSFDILPVGRIRIGQLSILDDRFPLNVPGWYEDNHPLDCRDFHLAEAEAEVARDARAHPDAATREARTTQLGLLINHDYLEALASWRGDPVHFTWWPGTKANGPGAPDYIVRCRGFHELYPGKHFMDYYPQLEADVAAGRVPYTVLRQWEGPDGGSVVVYVKRPSFSSPSAYSTQ
jgi:hypothetical protein